MCLKSLHDDALEKFQIYTHSVFQWVDSVHSPPPPPPPGWGGGGGGGGGQASYQTLKKAGLAESQFLEGDCWERWGNFFYGGWAAVFT